jgi:hypothetical protein
LGVVAHGETRNAPFVDKDVLTLGLKIEKNREENKPLVHGAFSGAAEPQSKSKQTFHHEGRKACPEQGRREHEVKQGLGQSWYDSSIPSFQHGVLESMPT